MTYYITMKVKESKGEHYNLADNYKNLKPENAILILTSKYCQKSKKKSFIDKIKQVFPEIDKELKLIFKQ